VEKKMSNDRIETVSKFFTMLSDLAKFVGIASLAAFAVASIAAPEWAQRRLDSLGLQVKEVNAFGIKIAAKEAVKAGNGVISIADGLTNAEISLGAIRANLPKEQDTSAQAAEISRAMAGIKFAQNALDAQAEALGSTGKAVGLAQEIPTTGWLYIGNFTADNKPRFVSPRIAPHGIQRSGNAISGVVLRYDAHIVSDGDDCTKVDIKDVPMPDPKAPEREFAILKASESNPLEVLKVSECPSIGDGKSVYVQVRVSKDRVRFSQLSKLAQ
jgi:hypothetical protein